MAGKHTRKHKKSGAHMRRHSGKTGLVMLIVLLVFAVSAGGTLAFMAVKTAREQNEFVPANVACKIIDKNDGTFHVNNTGDIDAYIRAAITVNWVDDSENVRGIAPAAEEYALEINSEDWWTDPATGFYYYRYAVVPGAATGALVLSFEPAEGVTAPEGYDMSLEIVAEAIQADGDTDDEAVPAYRDAWGIASISGD